VRDLAPLAERVDSRGVDPEAGRDLADREQVVGAAVDRSQLRPCRNIAGNQPRNAPRRPNGTRSAPARFAYSPKAIRRNPKSCGRLRSALTRRLSQVRSLLRPLRNGLWCRGLGDLSGGLAESDQVVQAGNLRPPQAQRRWPSRSPERSILGFGTCGAGAAHLLVGLES